jgi:hypothetical protein
MYVFLLIVVPDCDDESEDDQQSLQKFVNDLSKGDDDLSTENLKGTVVYTLMQ